MYKLCKTERSALRQKEIESALLEIIKKKPYNDVTITELCDKLEMPRKTFYRYFESKDDALYALIEHTLTQYSGFKGDGENKEKVRKMHSFLNFDLTKSFFLQ